MRLPVELAAGQAGAGRTAVVIDLSLAGAGLETEEPLRPGDRLSLTLSTPTMWDPLLIDGVVAWVGPQQTSNDLDTFGRPRSVARAGLAFDYPTASAVLAMFEMLATLGYE